MIIVAIVYTLPIMKYKDWFVIMETKRPLAFIVYTGFALGSMLGIYSWLEYKLKLVNKLERISPFFMFFAGLVIVLIVKGLVYLFF